MQFELATCLNTGVGYRCSPTDAHNNIKCFFSATNKIANPALRAQLLFDSFTSAIECGNVALARMIAATKEACTWDEATLVRFEKFTAEHVGVEELMIIGLCEPLLPNLVARAFKVALRLELQNQEALINILGILINNRPLLAPSSNTNPRFTTDRVQSPKPDVFTLIPGPEACRILAERTRTGTCAISYLLTFLFSTLPETFKTLADSNKVAASDLANFGTESNVHLVKRTWQRRCLEQRMAWDHAYSVLKTYECDGELTSQAFDYDPHLLAPGLRIMSSQPKLAALLTPETYVGPLFMRSLRATQPGSFMAVQYTPFFGPHYHGTLFGDLDRATNDESSAKLAAPHALNVHVAPWLLFRHQTPDSKVLTAPGGFADMSWRKYNLVGWKNNILDERMTVGIENEGGSLYGFSDEHSLLFCSSHSNPNDWLFKEGCPHRPDHHFHLTSHVHPFCFLMHDTLSVSQVRERAGEMEQKYIVSDAPRADRTDVATTGKCGFLYTIAHHRDDLKLVSLAKDRFQQNKLPLWHVIGRMKCPILLALALPLDAKGKPLFDFEPTGLPDEVLIQTVRNIILANSDSPVANMRLLCIYVLMLQLQAASEYDAQQEWPAEVAFVAKDATSSTEFNKLPQRQFRSPLNRRYVECYHLDGPFEMSRSVWMANAIGRMIPAFTNDPAKSGADDANNPNVQNAHMLSYLKCIDTDNLNDLGVKISLKEVHPTKQAMLCFGRNGFAIKSMIRMLACALLEEVMRLPCASSESRAGGLVDTLLLWLRSARRCIERDRNLGCAPRRSTTHFVSEESATWLGVTRRVTSIDTDLPLGIKFTLVCGMIVHQMARWPEVVRALYDNRARPPPDEAAALGDRAGSFLWTAFLWLASVDLTPLNLSEEQRADALTELLDIITQKNARLDIDYKTILRDKYLEVLYDPVVSGGAAWFFCDSSPMSPYFNDELVGVCTWMRCIDDDVIYKRDTTTHADDSKGKLLRFVRGMFVGATEQEGAFRTSLSREAVLVEQLAEKIPNAVEPSLQSRILQDTLPKEKFASFLTFILACLDLNNQRATELAETLMLPPYSALPPEPPEPNAAVLACINRHIYKPGGEACQRLRTDFEARSAEQGSNKRPGPAHPTDRLGTGWEAAELGEPSTAPPAKRAKAD